MRNWNSIMLSSFITCFWLRAYLWGIETLSRRYFCRYLIIVASLPMRNWNSSKSSIKSDSFSCCEPTYEELKHDILWISEKNKNRGCEPTYEELKPLTFFKSSDSCPSGLRAYLWGIETMLPELLQTINLDGCEPTYEELKPVILLISTASTSSVASLPMRNWNSHRLHPSPQWGQKVASLPMRNWNLEPI